MSHMNTCEQAHFNSKKLYAIPFLIELIFIQLPPDVFNQMVIIILECLISILWTLQKL